MQSVHKTITTKSRRMCSVFQCSTYCTKDISLHSFPSDPKLCKAWQTALKIGKPVTKYMLVCSLHFTENDFTLTTSKLRRLKKQATPSRNIPKLSCSTKKPAVDRSERHCNPNIITSFCKYSSSCNMVKKALVFLAPGAEEMEFVISVDVLRRGGIDVTIAGLPDSSLVKCSRDVNIKPDIGVSEASSKGPFDIIVLPGGLGGAKAMAESKIVGQLLKEQEAAGRWIAAICAAPTALKAHRIAEGKSVTSYPAMKAQMEEGGKYNYKEDKVVVDSNLITSRGPGTAFDFGLAMVDKIAGKEKASEVAKAMLLCY